MRKAITTIIATLALGVLSPGILRAGSITCDFTTDPTAAGFTITGTFASWQNTGGNPGGFIQLTDFFQQEERGAILLPDFDAGKPIKSFTVSMDVRIGAGTDLPGEGWSINFVPANAQVVVNGADGPGWASDFTPTANLPERGSAEGLGVYALTYDHGGGDILGFNARYNQTEFVVGGWTLPPSGPKHLNGLCGDIYSLQTGTNYPPFDPTTLCWTNFTMVMHEGGTLDIIWKGSTVVSGFQTPWTPQPGRWILAARSSAVGSEVHQFDNIVITTAAADKPQLANFFGYAGGFAYTIADMPGAVLDPASIRLTLDGAAVTASSVNKASTNTTIVYTSLLTTGSHTATIAYSSTSGAAGTGTNTFSVGAYTTIPSSYAVTGVNTSQRGFRIRPYQTIAAQPNTIAWTEAQLAGLYGANIADMTGADAQGFYVNSGVVNYDIDPAGVNGHFNAPQQTDVFPPGIPNMLGLTGNLSEEMITWLYFPAAGAYLMGVNSDDGFKVSTSAVDVRDPNGLILGEFNGGRGASDTMFTFAIQQAGYYPFRLIWENGSGELGAGNAANVEWFTQLPDGSLALVNDPANAQAVKAYSSGPLGLPFVQSFTSGFVGFTYRLVDGTTAVADGTIQTKLNGQTVVPTVTHSGGIATVTYAQAQPLPSPSQNTVVLSFADNGTTPVTQTVTNTFAVSGAIIPPGIALTTGVDTTKPGFAARPYQTAAAEPNSVWWMEQQLAGLEGANTADLALATDGWFTNGTVVNYDATADANGHFNSPTYIDQTFPGQASGSTAFDNASMEILAWVNFPAPGSYSMGVNSDDGFKLSLGANPRDQFAPILGLYDGGRGASDTIFQFYIPTAGYYPMRLIWENGNGGCNLEWFSVQPDGTPILVNDTVAGALQAFASGPLATPAYVSLLNPYVNELNTDPLTSFYVQFTDGSTQVDSSSVAATINGAAVSGLQVNKVGGITTAQAPMPFMHSGSTNTATLTYKEVGATTPITHTWQFVMATFQTLPVSGVTPIGSGIASKPGFKVKVAQLPIGFNNTELNPSAEAIEQVLAGLWGTNQALASSNVADLTLFTDNGYYDLTGVINISGNNAGAELGNFTTANGYTDAANPGIPGTTGYNDQFAGEFITYIEFPQAGYYRMGVASDDCFRVYPTDQRPAFLGATLYVTQPAAIAGQILPGDPAWGAGGWGGSTPIWPIPAMTAKVVLANPNTGGGPPPVALNNAADIAGNICLIDRGANEFGVKAVDAQLSGAIACIIVNNRLDFPISMGSGAYGTQATIPVMMIHQNDGAILKAHLSDPGGVWVTVGWDPEMVLGEYDVQGGRGTADSWFLFGVAQAGVYPFRLAYNQGGGGYSCEWFTVDQNGNRTLVNDVAKGGLKAYRERIPPATAPALSISRPGGVVTITYEGTLQSASSPAGPWSLVTGASSPYTPPTTGAATFFRSFR
ncbi:MAG TPA: PA domain-containing protein [Verrucomicrobiae bacterium]